MLADVWSRHTTGRWSSSKTPLPCYMVGEALLVSAIDHYWCIVCTTTGRRVDHYWSEG